MKIAIIHDWLTGMRGGEKCLLVLCELFPSADLFTLVHVPGSVSETIEKREVHTSFLNRIPGIGSKYRNFLPLFPRAIESFDLAGYDAVISSSHCVAKGVRVPEGAYHFSYIYTPMRYIWDMFDEYFGPGRAGFGKRFAAKLFRGRLRKWDRRSSDGVDTFCAISSFVAERVQRIYGRDSKVVYPPADVDYYTPGGDGRGDYYLVVSALVPYKRTDLAIESVVRFGRKLIVVGSGPDEDKLRERFKGANVEFAGWVDGEELRGYYRRARALIFPQVEDFGIVPVEANACGTPVIAYAAGGALESLIPLERDDDGGYNENATGLFFREQSVESLEASLRLFEDNEGRFSSVRCVENAVRFSRERFAGEISAAIRAGYEAKTGKAPEF